MFFIKNDFNKYAVYSLFSSFEVNSVILLLYLASLFGDYATASLLISIKLISNIVQKIFLSSFKDRVDFKYTLSLAEFSSAIGYIFYGLAPFIPNLMMEIIILGLFFDALGGALWGGTYNASLYTQFEDGKSDKDGATAYGRLQTMLLLGIGLGQMTGGALSAAYSYNFAMWFGAIPNIIASVLALTLKKNSRQKVAVKEKSLKHFVGCFNRIMKKRELKYIFIGNIYRKSLGVTGNEFIVPFYKTAFSLSAIGIILPLKEVIGGVTFWFSGEIVKKLGFKKSVKYSLISRNLLELFALTFNIYLAPLFYSLKSLVFGPLDTSLLYTIQKEVPDEDRTTIFTVISVFTSVVSSVLLVIAGFIADISSVWWALMVLLPFKTIPLYYYNKAYKIIEAR
jgi:MFS family permease